MHPHIARLHAIASKGTRRIIGLMSGTSLDGLDIALCEVSGAGLSTEARLVAFATEPYDEGYREKIRSVFSRRDVDLQTVCLLNPWVGRFHADLILKQLQCWEIEPKDVDLIASHGQTIYHAPRSLHGDPDYPNATLQIGDGDHMAERLGVITISDFRQKHLAAGGEGAPLAAYGDLYIFSDPGEDRVMLNIGGIANLTFLPKSQSMSDVYCSDIGPGNTMMDALMQASGGAAFDADAAVARAGGVHGGVLAALEDHAFFEAPFPKTTGPELFNLDYWKAATSSVGAGALSLEDAMATLNQFAADMIVRALQHCLNDRPNAAIYASGGGVHNPLLMDRISAALPQVTIGSTDALMINPDAKEAVLFAVLANECVAGDGRGAERGGPAMPSTTMGKVSFAD